ncbi:MAG: hypothetical protein JW759_08060 [Candidatus Coatesbacteria bacterium]|nr:hypothetical protein [Candidatus Coatesbacteria bacterium]
MKKLLLVAFAVVAVATIAFAISGSTNSVPSRDSLAQAGDDNDGETRGTNSCLQDFWVVSCVQAPSPGYCRVGFGIKHIEQSDPCCNHSPGSIRIRINNGVWCAMTAMPVELADPCDKYPYKSGGFDLREGEEADIDFDCSGHSSCTYSTGYTPYCTK